jgi:hypothetical protein
MLLNAYAATSPADPLCVNVFSLIIASSKRTHMARLLWVLVGADPLTLRMDTLSS